MKQKLRYTHLYEVLQDGDAKASNMMQKIAGAALTSLAEINTICNRLGSLQFWCNDNFKHLHKPDGLYRQDYCCMTHVVGLPVHSKTKKEMPLTPYQVEFCNKVINIEETDPNFFHLYHLLKARQMGFTEIVLRLIQYFCFNRYAGRNVGIVAATNGNLAKKDLRRFYRLFKHIPESKLGGIKNQKLELINGTIIEAFAASEESLTGDTDYGAIFMDEAAKWKITDDTPVFNSIMPIVRMCGSDLFLVSTPKGPLKMFYKIYVDNKHEKGYIFFKFDIWRTEGNLNTREQILVILATKTEDVNQEYLCMFTHGSGAILADYVEQNRGEGWEEWNINAILTSSSSSLDYNNNNTTPPPVITTEEEDDHYEEPDNIEDDLADW